MRDDVGSRGVCVGNVTHGLCVRANDEAGGKHEGGRGSDVMHGRALCKFLKEEVRGRGTCTQHARRSTSLHSTSMDTCSMYVCIYIYIYSHMFVDANRSCASLATVRLQRAARALQAGGEERENLTSVLPS